MQIETTRFGRIEVPEESILQFPRGLYGLEQARSFCVLQHDDSGCFYWLQSTEEPALAMLITDPFQFFSSYEVEIADSAAELLQVTTPAEVATYVTVTLAKNGCQLHANLLGPLVINHRAGLGTQVIQNAERYTTRHLIGERAAAGEQEVVAPEAALSEGDPRAIGESRGRRFQPLTVPI